jgi:hypothetical protein
MPPESTSLPHPAGAMFSKFVLPDSEYCCRDADVFTASRVSVLYKYIKHFGFFFNINAQAWNCYTN